MPQWRVPPEGPLEATIAIVGEGPGSVEMARGRPFQGKTGQELNELLELIGLARSQVYLTNVEKNTTEKPDHGRQIQCALELVREFQRMPNLNVIVALGGISLETLTGWKQQSITRWRGSILEAFFGTKLISTFHPAYYMRGEWRFKPIVLADLERAVAQSTFSDLRLPQRQFFIEPTYADALAWLHKLESANELAVDIETTGWGWGQTYVACIGFSPDPLEAYCIPFIGKGRAPYWTTDQELNIWRAISKVLQSKARKYFHNGMFDIPVLNEHFVKVSNFHMDTMLSHALIYSELPHGLDFVSSIYTEEPYYKEEGKTWRFTQDVRQYWTYNCKDCCVTLEAGRELEKELAEFGMTQYFHERIMPLTWPLMEMQRVGFCVDKERLARLRLWLEEDLKFKQHELNLRAKFPVNVKSPKDMVRLLTENGIRITRETKTGLPKLDEESIREYCRQAAANRGGDVTIGDEALAIREKRTLLSNFVDIETDDEGMYHLSLTIHTTKTGRLSGRAPRDIDDNPKGPQPQNIPLECRGVFVARPGKTLLSADLKQAEAMYVAYDAQDEKMMEIFSTGKDIHKFNAANLFKKPQEHINYTERWIAKRIVHGFDYGMGARRVISVLAKDGFYIAEREAHRCQASYFQACPAVQSWQARIGEAVRLRKRLTNPFGRVRLFLGQYDDAVWREALAQNAQSTIADITNGGIIKLYETLPDHARVVLQVHDEVVIECDEDKWHECARMAFDALTCPINIHGRVLVIPVEMKRGKYWATEMVEVHQNELDTDTEVPNLHTEARSA